MRDRDSIRAGLSRGLRVPLWGPLTRAARPGPLAALAGLTVAALMPGLTATAAAATTPAAPPPVLRGGWEFEHHVGERRGSARHV